jgi:hypothetical protein
MVEFEGLNELEYPYKILFYLGDCTVAPIGFSIKHWTMYFHIYSCILTKDLQNCLFL